MTVSENFDATRPVLLTGATGYVGGLLLQKLEQNDISVRCFVRNPDKLDTAQRLNTQGSASKTEIVSGDVLEPTALQAALRGIHTAYYLVHSMGYSPDFAETDRQAAQAFGAAARAANVQRIIYLGGLGDDDDPHLSPHLRSRHEVGQILRDSGVETIEFRASAILGAGSLSFEMIRSLTNRLPIMICPRWLSTPTQPIATQDLIQYLVEALSVSLSSSRIFEIGGSDVVTYGELIQEYSRQQGLRRWMISVPVLTPYLSGLWLGLVTPSTAEVGRHLIEGLRNPTIVSDKSAQEFFSFEPMGIQEAVLLALDT